MRTPPLWPHLNLILSQMLSHWGLGPQYMNFCVWGRVCVWKEESIENSLVCTHYTPFVTPIIAINWNLPTFPNAPSREPLNENRHTHTHTDKKLKTMRKVIKIEWLSSLHEETHPGKLSHCSHDIWHLIFLLEAWDTCPILSHATISSLRHHAKTQCSKHN